MNIGGELIQISLGPGSNAVTSHLCNLQGLSCTSPHYSTTTSSSSSDYNDPCNDPLCDPYITHAVQGETYVPRVLFVDGKNCFDSWSLSSSGAGNGNADASSSRDEAVASGLETWRGKVQIHHRNNNNNNNNYISQQAQSATSTQEASATASSYNSNRHGSLGGDTRRDTMTGYNDKQTYNYRYYSDNSNMAQWNSVLSPGQRHAFDNFQQTASVLSSTPHVTSGGGTFSSSRYHSSRYKHVSSQFVRNRERGEVNADDNDRVMRWDLQDQEEEEDHDDDLVYMQDTEYSQRKFEEEKRRQDKYNQSLHCDLTNYWNEFLGLGVDDGIEAGERLPSGATPSPSPSVAAVDASRHGQEPQSGKTSSAEREGNRQDDHERVATQSEIARHNALSALHWMQYFMPPHPGNNMYSAPLPFHRCCFNNSKRSNDDTKSSVQDKDHHHHHHQLVQEREQQQQKDQTMLYSYYAGMNPVASSSQSFCSMNEMSMGITREWREDVLSNKLRKWMEDCDCVKGFQILLDGDQALFGGLAASVLEELSDECKSATKFSVVVHGGDDFIDDMGGSMTSALQEKELAYWRSENRAVRAFRNDLSQGLLLHGVTCNSDLVLPLSLSRCWQSLEKKEKWGNLFEASAAAAIILETATLPFRFARGNPKTASRSKIGIASGYFQGSSSLEENDMFPIADKLTFHEYISSLKPSSHRHLMAEMSCLSHAMSPVQLHESLLQGTSIERRQLEQERNTHRYTHYKRTRGRDVDPGLWMEDCGPNGGILTSLSPINLEFSSRSLHRHFALASSFRALPSTVGNIVSTYTTSLMEGEIIRHRPLSSVASVAAQSFYELTDPNTSYSAGSYWNTIFGSQQQTRTFQPLSVMGNTTRIHGHLNRTANGLKTALSQKYKGYLRRDNMAGLAPEVEDCEEAKESCLSLRDLYEPPMSGHEWDEEGVYFEDNSD